MTEHGPQRFVWREDVRARRDRDDKQALACRDWPDMDSYAAAKTEFIERCIRDCEPE